MAQGPWSRPGSFPAEPDRSRARNASGSRGRSAAGGLRVRCRTLRDAPPAVRGPGAEHAHGAGNVARISAPLRRRRGGRVPVSLGGVGGGGRGATDWQGTGGPSLQQLCSTGSGSKEGGGTSL